MKHKPTYQELETELDFLKNTNHLLDKSSIVRFRWKNQKNWPIEYASENVASVFGYSADDFINGVVKYTEIIHPDDLQKVINEVKTKGSENNFSFDHQPYRIIDKNGTTKWIKDTTLLIKNDNNVITHHNGIIVDISDYVRMKEMLKNTEDQYKRFVDHSPDIIYKFSNIRGGLFWSKKVKDILGFDPEEIIDNPFLWRDSIHPDDKEEVKNALEDNEKGADFNIEYRIKTKQGKWIWLHDYFMDKSYIGDEIIIEGHATDITVMKTAQKKLEESNKTKDKFFSIIAHDLKSPFNSLLGFSDILFNEYDEHDEKNKKHFVGLIFRGLRDTYSLLENLLYWSRSQRGTIIFNPEKLNLYLISKKTIKSIQLAAKNKSIELINQIPEDIFVEADKDMLSSIIRNLISNAVKYTPENGKIVINAQLTTDVNNNDFTKITVKDNGVGISEKRQALLFNIGEDTSTKGTENEKGTGLGLILCKEFVEKHNGKIWIESELEKGSSFFFTMPVAR